ncbi:hypothetical protein NYE40_05980 [Paenibacillus sp. FSL W8-1187]
MANPSNDSKEQQKQGQQAGRKTAAPGSPGYDKKLDGPNRPSI